MENQLTEVIRYISEREEQLSHYSDKLRQAVIRVFDTFGDPGECQICNWWNSKEQTQHFRYSKYAEHNFDEYGVSDEELDELLQSGKYFFETEKGPKYNEKGQIRIWPNKDWHNFVPKIRLSLDVEGPTYLQDQDIERKLASRKGRLVILEVIVSFGDERFFGASDISRKELKQIVKEKRISEFLQIYREKLGQATQEYQEVSSLAEKMASVLPGGEK